MKTTILSLAALTLLASCGTNMQLTDCAWKAHDGQQPD